MKRGDKVYRVVPVFGLVRADMTVEVPESGSWYVQSRELVVASPKQFRLDSYFLGGANIIYPASALGREFYATPVEAVDAFIRAASRRLENAQHALWDAQANVSAIHAWNAAWRMKSMTPEDK